MNRFPTLRSSNTCRYEPRIYGQVMPGAGRLDPASPNNEKGLQVSNESESPQRKERAVLVKVVFRGRVVHPQNLTEGLGTALGPLQVVKMFSKPKLHGAPMMVASNCSMSGKHLCFAVTVPSGPISYGYVQRCPTIACTASPRNTSQL